VTLRVCVEIGFLIFFVSNIARRHIPILENQYVYSRTNFAQHRYEELKPNC